MNYFQKGKLNFNEKYKMKEQEIDNAIDLLVANRINFMNTCIILSKYIFTEKSEAEHNKQMWYLLKADEILVDHKSVSMEDKEDFLTVHLRLMEEFRHDKLKPLTKFSKDQLN